MDKNKSSRADKSKKQNCSAMLSKEYYNVKLQRSVIIIFIILAFIGCCFALPWGIYFLSKLFGVIGWTADDLNGLSNFLGGLFGVFLGFIIENLLIGKLQQLGRYMHLIECLNREFKNINRHCKECIENGTAEGIKVWIFNDIISSAENETLFYSLPRYFMRKFKKGSHVEKLHDINGKINEINKMIDLALTNGSKTNYDFKKGYEELENKINEFFTLSTRPSEK